MTRVRIYVPASAADVRALVEVGFIAPRPRIAYAVSPALVARTPRADTEEREYLAYLEAAAAAAPAAAGGRRVVIAADVEFADTDTATGAGFDFAGALGRGDVVSLHVDEDPGLFEGDLLWYDATEAVLVLDLLDD